MSDKDDIAARELAIKEGYTYWGGREGPPADWASGWKCLLRDGRLSQINTDAAEWWRHDPTRPEDDVIGYISTKRE